MSEKATVETTTATVQVLKMGGRQVTMGVVRQLDNVEPQHIEPMGRVRMEAGELDLIGSDKRTGNLVRCRIPYMPTMSIAHLNPTGEYRIAVCDGTSMHYEDYLVDLDGSPLRVPSARVAKRGCGDVKPRAGQVPGCENPLHTRKSVAWAVVGDHGKHAREHLSEVARDIFAIWATASQQPLIVLAGAR